MKIIKIIGIIFGIIALLIIGGLIYITTAFPKVDDAPDITVAVTPERVERGDYLANNVMVCIDCHSVRDWTKFSGPIVPGTEGGGGEKFTEEMGFPGNFFAPNITPTNLRDWTDGEIYRAITCGVNRDGDPLFPVMPYHKYGTLDDEDIYSVIAYLRKLEPLDNQMPKSEPSFPFSIIMNFIPQQGTPGKKPDKSNTLEYGKYIATAGACADCHTPFEKGQPLAGMEFSGGREFTLPFGLLKTPNITPHQGSGIGKWTEEMFVKRFKMYTDSAYVLPDYKEGELFTLMPWTMYAGMDEYDLKAMYAYLMSLKPIDNNVVQFTPNTAGK